VRGAFPIRRVTRGSFKLGGVALTDALLQQGGLDADGDSVALSLTAELVAGQQVVPVGGGVTVTATRRGKTAVEPQPTPAPAGR